MPIANVVVVRRVGGNKNIPQPIPGAGGVDKAGVASLHTRYPLIYQDQARTIDVKKLPKGIPRTCGMFVILGIAQAYLRMGCGRSARCWVFTSLGTVEISKSSGCYVA